MTSWMSTLLLVIAPAIDEPASAGPETLRGEVVLLSEALGALGLGESQGPIDDQVVLGLEDGRALPMLYSVGSRAFFEDDRLRGRPAELVVRRFESLPYLLVLSARVADDRGRFRTPEYDCEICSISLRYDQPCPCCQGPLELRLRPEDD